GKHGDSASTEDPAALLPGCNHRPDYRRRGTRGQQNTSAVQSLLAVPGSAPRQPRPGREPGMRYGATCLRGGGVRFCVWAPSVRNLAVKIETRLFPMTRTGEDFEVTVPDAHAGQHYFFVLDNSRERPDPVSRSQPEGVHGPSEIVDPDSFAWSDGNWKGIP